MTHSVAYRPAGEGTELSAPDAVLTVKVDALHSDGHYEIFEVDAPRGPATPLHRTGWGKTYYVLQGRMLVQVDAEAFDLGPGTSVTIPARSLHTFTVLSPSVTFLTVSEGDGMGRFHADLDASVPRGLAFDQVAGRVQAVVGRHDVELEGIDGPGDAGSGAQP